jgi:hypothetical protein
MRASRQPSHIFAARHDGAANRTTLAADAMCAHRGIATFAMKNAATDIKIAAAIKMEIFEERLSTKVYFLK